MTSIRSPKPLDLKFRSSRCLCGYFIGLHGLVAVSVWLAVPWLIASLGTLLLVLSLAFYVFRDICFFGDQAVSRIAFSENRWRIYRGDVRSGDIVVKPVDCVDATVLSFAVLLRFRAQGYRLSRSIVVLPDQLRSEQYRKLRQVANFARLS